MARDGIQTRGGVSGKMTHKFLKISDVNAGDVLLGRADDPNNRHLEKMTAETGSRYSHAAIYLGNGEVAEATLDGIEISKIESLVDHFDHIAVIGRHDLWGNERLDQLRTFIKTAIAVNAKYNARALYKFAEGQGKHVGNLQAQLEDFFAGNIEAPTPDKLCYFCSELVVAGFIKAGIITDSASIVYRPDKYSPIGLAADGTFGYFKGFLTSKNDYTIPEDDSFYQDTPMD